MCTQLYRELKKIQPGLSHSFIKLERSCNTHCTVCVYGAVITSWVCNGEEKLFFSKTNKLDGDSLMLGGISIEFPQYDKVTPERVFTKYNNWIICSGPKKKSCGDIELVLALPDNVSTRGIWNRRFLLVYTIVLTAHGIKLRAQVTNKSEKPFSFSIHFSCHMLFNDLNEVQFNGLPIANIREFPRIENELDRVFPKIKSPVSFHEKGRHVQFDFTKFIDVALWIPLIENPLQNEEELHQSIIVEFGDILDLVDLKQNEVFTPTLNINLSGIDCLCEDKAM